jgi:membrane fusion protein (multidrug efflux system)
VLKASAAKVNLAKAQRNRIQTMLEYGEIRAPFDGMVMKRFVDAGAFIQPADGNSAARPLLTITRIDVVRIWLDLPMAEVRWLNRGDRVVFDRINVLPGVVFEGEVTRFVTGLDATSRMMRVEVDLANPERQLLPGYYGYVTVMLDEMPQTPVVPSSALFKNGSESCVYVVENGICRRRPITTCFQDGTTVGIDSGLTTGEQVILAGGGQLRDGQQVVAVNAGA